MRKLLMCFLMLLLLCGCSAIPRTVETVKDTAVISTEAWNDETDEIAVTLPESAQMLADTGAERYYHIADSNVEVMTVRLLSSNAETAIKYLTGLTSPHIKTVKCGDKLYAVWCVQTEEGRNVCWAAVQAEDIYTYCMICTVSEESSGQYENEMWNILSQFDLQTPEMV